MSSSSAVGSPDWARPRASSRTGARVTLLEKRAQLGGRAYSIVDETTGDIVDNGQHLFMGCYRATQAFLERIGAADKVRWQDRLELTFADGGDAASSRRLAGRGSSDCPPCRGAIGWRW